MIGTGTDGTMDGFLTKGFNVTGGAGKITDIGGDGLGAFRAISLDHKNKDSS
ncbi:MAG: hypothetical protein ACYDFU_08115 [Nitrospirota bacterium]